MTSRSLRPKNAFNRNRFKNSFFAASNNANDAEMRRQELLVKYADAAKKNRPSTEDS